MKYEETNQQKMKVRDLQIAYIGGGSRGWAWNLMTDLAMEPQLSGTVRLYDIDREAANNNAIIGNRLSAREDAPGKWEYVTVPSLKEALTGADFVVISILPGTFDEMESDVHLPERLGIYQSVGDTAGPGGMIRALRTLPMFVTFAQAIRDYAPKAWVINYTNPMSLCVKILYHVFPEIKAFGCCHEVFGTQRFLRDVYQEVCHAEQVNWQDIDVTVTGINHFTWFTSASYKGHDLFPVLEEYMEHNYEPAPVLDENWMSKNNYFSSANQVKMDLYKRFGFLGAAGDRHLAEFMPGDEYLNDPETVARWKFKLTPVSWRKEDLKERRKRSARLVAGEENIDLTPTGEEGIALIKALLGFGRLISNVNVPNTAGQIANLPASAIVETNAVFERDRIHPVTTGDMPGAIRELVLPHVENHERILKASLLCDKEMVVDAFLHDPLVKGQNPGVDEVRSLVEDMIANTKNFLPRGWGF